MPDDSHPILPGALLPGSLLSDAIPRRSFLAGLTTAGISLAIPLTGPRPESSQPFSAQPTRAIDIHHHYIPPELLVEARSHSQSLGIEVNENSRGQTVI